MNKKDILAIDPGKVNGVVRFLGNKMEFAKELTEPKLLDLIVEVKPEILVVESFVNYPWMQSPTIHSFPTAELIGKLKLLAQQHNIKVVMQPASIKKVVNDAVLKHFGFEKHKSTHVNDALRHALYYLKWTNK